MAYKYQKKDKCPYCNKIKDERSRRCKECQRKGKMKQLSRAYKIVKVIDDNYGELRQRLTYKGKWAK